MASNPPGKCCAEGALHEGTPIGTRTTVAGLETYEVGKENGNDRVLVILTDIYGSTLVNTLLLADGYAKEGYHVFVPEIVKNDPYDSLKEELPIWLQRHPTEEVSGFLEPYLRQIKKELAPKTFVGIGYCFGAKFVVQSLGGEDPVFTAGALAHPSFVTEEEVEKVKNPVIISAAQTDPIFTVELRHKTEEILTKNKIRFQIDLFSGVAHGFAVRGDLSDKVVLYSKEKAFADVVHFFKQY